MSIGLYTTQLCHFFLDVYLSESVLQSSFKFDFCPPSSLLFIEKNLVDVSNLRSYLLCRGTNSFDISREIYLFQ